MENSQPLTYNRENNVQFFKVRKGKERSRYFMEHVSLQISTNHNVSLCIALKCSTFKITHRTRRFGSCSSHALNELKDRLLGTIGEQSNVTNDDMQHSKRTHRDCTVELETSLAQVDILLKERRKSVSGADAVQSKIEVKSSSWFPLRSLHHANINQG